MSLLLWCTNLPLPEGCLVNQSCVFSVCGFVLQKASCRKKKGIFLQQSLTKFYKELITDTNRPQMTQIIEGTINITLYQSIFQCLFNINKCCVCSQDLHLLLSANDTLALPWVSVIKGNVFLNYSYALT